MSYESTAQPIELGHLVHRLPPYYPQELPEGAFREVNLPQLDGRRLPRGPEARPGRDQLASRRLLL
jgi:hypothetical protein